MTTAPVVPDSEYLYRLLTWPDREACAAVLKRLHQRVHGADADPSEVLTRDHVLGLVQQVLSEPLHRERCFEPGEAVTPDLLRATAQRLVQELRQQGWLQERIDPHSLQPCLRLTRTGQTFGGALSRLERPRPSGGSRQRHLRAVAKALAAFLAQHATDDLLDALDYSRRVGQDLQDDLEHFRGLVQSLTREALDQKVDLDELNEYVERRFARDVPARHLVDSAERHRAQILQMLERMRAEATPAQDAALLQQAGWLEDEVGDASPVVWVCDRIEATLEAACGLKLPVLRRETDHPVQRFSGLLRQALAVDTGASSVLLRLMARVKAGSAPLPEAGAPPPDGPAGGAREGEAAGPDDHEGDQPQAGDHASAAALLDRLGWLLATSQVALPAGTLRWIPADGAPAAPAATVSDLEILAWLKERGGERGVRLSDLPLRNAREVRMALQAVSAARSPEGRRFYEVRRLPSRVETDYFATADHEFVPRKDA